MSRYLTSDPVSLPHVLNITLVHCMVDMRALGSPFCSSWQTQPLALTRDGRPYMDFAAAPSL